MIFNGNEITKKYYRHSGYVGNLHEKSAKDTSNSEMLEKAIKGMLPKNKLQAPRLARLRVNAGETHENAAQTPEKVEVK
jgi:large subunit ribosomal protein L13